MVQPDDNDKTQTYLGLTKDTQVEHYRTVNKIGTGGTSEVYLTEDTELDRKVALKVRPTHLCHAEDCRRRGYVLDIQAPCPDYLKTHMITQGKEVILDHSREL